MPFSKLPPLAFMRGRWLVLRIAGGLALAALVLGSCPPARVEAERPPAPPADLGSGPGAIGFVPNRGQWHPRVRYRLAGAQGTILVLDDGLLALPRERRAPAWRLRFEPSFGASLALRPGPRLEGRLTYLIGDDPRAWASGLPHHAAVEWQAPGSGARLGLRVDGGVLRLQVDRAAASARIEGGSARSAEGPPWAWEHIEREARPAGGASDGLGADWPRSLQAAFDRSWREASRDAARAPARDGTILRRAAGPFAPRSPAQGEARLAWSSYLGGGGSELVRGLAVDVAGHAYVAGSTTSSDLPTRDPLQADLGNGGSLQDAFVAKIAPDGQRLVWATYLGGNRQDEALDLAIDGEGRVHLTGYTSSPDFPMEKPIQSRVNLADGIFSGDAFATKLSADGRRLEWSTPLGGTARDIGKGVAVDAEGFVYVTGWTGSNFPGVNALYPLNRGVVDAFVVKITPTGDDVVYSTHLGGSDEDLGRDIAVDAAGNAYVVGTTQSVNFRVSEPLQRANAGGRDAFVARFASDGQALTWATYLGGRGDDFGTGVALGPDGAVTVVGRSDAPNFPRVDPFQRTRSGPSDLFVSRLTAQGDALVFSSYLGGSAVEGDCAAVDAPRVPATPTPAPGTPRLPEGSKFPDGPLAAVAVDGAGRTYVSTCTSSSNAPLARALQTTRSGRFAAYLAVLDPSGSRLELGSYLGGQGLDLPRALALGVDGAIYLAGQTTSSDFPTAPSSPIQAGRAGTDDGFALKIGPVFAPPTATPLPATATLEPSPTPLASPSPSPTGTPAASASPSPTPSATASPSPTPAPPAIWMPWLARSAGR